MSASLQKALAPADVARRSGLSVSALHFYEREGLIRAWRTSGGQRRYERAVLRRLAVIKAAQAVGIPLGVIKERLAALPHDRPPSTEDWALAAKGWEEDLTRRIDRLTRLKDKLSGCIGCGCLSLTNCPLRNPDDEMAKEGPGAPWLR